MALIDDVKLSLRIKNTAYDAEIADLINEAKADLLLSGVLENKTSDDADALISRAIKLYSKANFGLDNPDSEKYMVSYTSLKNHLCLSAEYTEAVI